MASLDPSVVSITKKTYILGTFAILPPHGNTGQFTKYSDEHFGYQTQYCRIRTVWTAQEDSVRLQSAAQDQTNGNAYYLPYRDDTISSMRVPGRAPSGVTLFMTAQMSGCKLFIDTIEGSNDLIIFHANTHLYPAPPDKPADYQDPKAVEVLDNMHKKAVANYAAANPKLVLHNKAVCDKKTYYGVSQSVLAQKTAAGKKDPKFYGGANIIGFYGTGGWNFYYQTSAKVVGKITSTTDKIKQVVTGPKEGTWESTESVPWEVVKTSPIFAYLT